MDATLPPDAEECELGIVFLDLARFSRWADGREDREVAGMLQTFYALAARHLQERDTRVVKVIGDAMLAVFEVEALSAVVDALLRLADEFERIAESAGFTTRVDGKVHLGPVITGSFGPPGLQRFDVLGKTVNQTALLRGEGIVLSATAETRLA